MSELRRKWVWPVSIAVIVLLSVVARFSFSTTNQFAPDRHFDVIRLLISKGVYPEVSECWACFQPSAFYRLSAVWLSVVEGLGLSIQGVSGIHSIQAMNSLIGLGTLFAIFFWLGRLGLSRATIAFTFALVALNPRLVAINGQVTNDSLAIFLCTVSLINVHLFYLTKRLAYLYVAAAVTALAMLTKGSALPCLGVFTVSLLFIQPAGVVLSLRRRAALVAGVWIVAVFGGGYYSNFLEFNTPFVLNYGRTVDQVFPQNTHLPLIYDHDEYHSAKFAAKRPPWGAIAWESVVTFRPVSLVSNPWNDMSPSTKKGEKRSPPHMRSVWTQIFARANSIGFHPSLPGWGYASAASHQLARALFTCALAVLSMVLVVLVRESRSLIRDVYSSWPKLNFARPALIPLVVFFGTAAFAAVYNLRLGHFSGTKAVYYLPGMMAYLYFFAIGREWIAERKALRWIFDGVVVLLLLLSVLEIGFAIDRIETVIENRSPSG